MTLCDQAAVVADHNMVTDHAMGTDFHIVSDLNIFTDHGTGMYFCGHISHLLQDSVFKNETGDPFIRNRPLHNYFFFAFLIASLMRSFTRWR